MATTSDRLDHLKREFARRFGRPCSCVARAPGRVNLIGEHVDYNAGLVLPVALKQSTWAAVAPRSDRHVCAWSDNLQVERRWPLDAWAPACDHDWTAYIAGVAAMLTAHGVPLPGFDLLIQSDVPVGAGLSSSAALELSTAMALCAAVGVTRAPAELAEICRAAEHAYAHVPCGIMDQYVSALARPGAALLLDCRDRTWRHVPLPLDRHALVIIDSGLSHTLASSEYAMRRSQCDAALERLREAAPEALSLRDITQATLEAQRSRLPAPLAKRAAHVVSEIARTQAAAVALGRGDLATFGDLLNASHLSLRDDYEVSTPEIDKLVEAARQTPGVYGARMTGAGFGGSIVAILHVDAIPALETRLATLARHGGPAPRSVTRCKTGEGATVEWRSA